MRKSILMAFFAVLTTVFVGCTKADFEGVITLDKKEIVFEADEDLTQNVSVTSNIKWSVMFANEADKEWISVKPENGNNNAVIAITATKNKKEEVREATITIGEGATIQLLKISQNAYTYNVIGFEDVVLDPETNQSFGTFIPVDKPSLDKKYGYTKFDATLSAFHNETYRSWNGISYSSNTDTETNEYSNEYSVFYKDAETGNGGANGSKTFAVMYYMEFYGPDFAPSISFPEGTVKQIDHLFINNSTFTALTILNGGGMSKKFEDGDWYKMTIIGYDKSGNEAGAIDFYLADYRDGKTDLVRDWTKVSLAELGEVNKVSFTFSSSDYNDYGILTPSYACIDNIAIEK